MRVLAATVDGSFFFFTNSFVCVAACRPRTYLQIVLTAASVTTLESAAQTWNLIIVIMIRELHLEKEARERNAFQISFSNIFYF